MVAHLVTILNTKYIHFKGVSFMVCKSYLKNPTKTANPPHHWKRKKKSRDCSFLLCIQNAFWPRAVCKVEFCRLSVDSQFPLPGNKCPTVVSEVELLITHPLTFWGKSGFWKQCCHGFCKTHRLPFPRTSCALFLTVYCHESAFIQGVVLLQHTHPACPRKARVWFSWPQSS